MAWVPDDVSGEAICVCVVPDEGAVLTGQESIDWCTVPLAGYEVLDFLRFVDEFPLTRTGKVRWVKQLSRNGSGRPRALQEMQDCRAL